MPKGRPAKTTSELIAAGTYRPGRHGRRSGFEPVAEVPPPPEWLGEHARAFWVEVAPLVCKLGTLRPEFEPAFSLLAASWGDYRNALDALAEQGYTTPTGSDGMKLSPWARIEDTAAKQCLVLLAEFGLSPMGRRKLGIVDAPPESDKAARFFVHFPEPN
jgi:P27 family predicted phage terminase small subunit